MKQRKKPILLPNSFLLYKIEEKLKQKNLK